MAEQKKKRSMTTDTTPKISENPKKTNKFNAQMKAKCLKRKATM